MKKLFKTFKSAFSLSFLKVMLPLAVPIALQNLLMSSFQLVDTLMIGQLGEVAIASVGSAGRVLNFIGLVFFGFASGGAVFLAQFWGSRDFAKMRKTYGLITACNVPIAIIFGIVCMLIPEKVMSIMTNDTSMIAAGADYLRIAAISYLGAALSQTFSTALRCTEEVKIPLISSLCAVILNAALNYILIFGKLGFSALGVKGAAIATSVSSLVNPLMMLLLSVGKKNILISSLKEMFGFNLHFAKQFFRRALPVVLNEALWVTASTGYDVIFGRMGADNYSALTIFRTVDGICFTFFIGICNACNVMVGKAIGEGDREKAIDYSNRYMLLFPIVSLVIGLGAIALSNPVLSLFKLTPAVRHTAWLLILIYGLELALRNIPYISIVGVFRGGGDTKSGVYYDLPVMFLFALPLTAVCGLVFKLDFVLVYLLMLLAEDIIKSILCLRRYISKKWIMPVAELQ